MKDQKDSKTPELSGVLQTKRGPGRPRVYASAAERQKAYRDRVKARGLRDVHRLVRDVREPLPLQSDVIALDHIPEWRR